MTTTASEGSKFCLQVSTELRNRGVQDILIAWVDAIGTVTAAPARNVMLLLAHEPSRFKSQLSMGARLQHAADTLSYMIKNVLGTVLQTCCTNPLTGFYRDGKCNTGPEDVGKHTVCVVLTDEFLEHQASIGNDLITPHPEFGFPGLKAGDQWCVCVEMWKKSYDAGVVCAARLEATHEKALEVVSLEVLFSSAHLDETRAN